MCIMSESLEDGEETNAGLQGCGNMVLVLQGQIREKAKVTNPWQKWHGSSWVLTFWACWFKQNISRHQRVSRVTTRKLQAEEHSRWCRRCWQGRRRAHRMTRQRSWTWRQPVADIMVRWWVFRTCTATVRGVLRAQAQRGKQSICALCTCSWLEVSAWQAIAFTPNATHSLTTASAESLEPA